MATLRELITEIVRQNELAVKMFETLMEHPEYESDQERFAAAASIHKAFVVSLKEALDASDD
jgi:hypothetical protein